VLRSLIFMRGQIDNAAPATQKGAPLPATRDTNRQSESFTLTTLGDGHTMPSENAVTPAASIEVAKLMDTLSRASSASMDVTSRCYVAVTYRPEMPMAAARSRSRGGLFPTRVPRKESCNSSRINKSAKISRHSFGRVCTTRGVLSKKLIKIRKMPGLKPACGKRARGYI
jgi:hypothetical protein